MTAAASGVDGLAEAEEVEAAHEEQEKVLQSIVFGGPNNKKWANPKLADIATFQRETLPW